ncbi:type II toxin-antitoxin system HicB family antitoxin [Candidatus Uhrbacteria bacterium]|nr:type II toxin-antitoxin system HicB family antitoxin [Candidatus Uhrbacteria bacterium]
MKDRILQYTVLLTPDEESGGFTVEVPAIPGCFTEGDTLEQAKANAKEVIELCLDVLADEGLPPPVAAADNSSLNMYCSKRMVTV